MRLLLAEFDDATQPESWHLRQLGKPAADDDECERLDRSAAPAASTAVAFGTELLFAHRRSRYVFVLEAAVVLHAARDTGSRSRAWSTRSTRASARSRATVADAPAAELEAHVSVVLHTGLATDRVWPLVRGRARARARAAPRARALRERVRVALALVEARLAAGDDEPPRPPAAAAPRGGDERAGRLLERLVAAGTFRCASCRRARGAVARARDGGRGRDAGGRRGLRERARCRALPRWCRPPHALLRARGRRTLGAVRPRRRHDEPAVVQRAHGRPAAAARRSRARPPPRARRRSRRPRAPRRGRARGAERRGRPGRSDRRGRPRRSAAAALPALAALAPHALRARRAGRPCTRAAPVGDSAVQ